MMRLFKLVVVTFLSCIFSPALSAQEKTQAYYNVHEKEIIPDATVEYKAGHYARTIELCKWHYIIVGDNAADSLREMAERCAQLTSDINSMKAEAEDKIKVARSAAATLLSLNANDSFARDYLQWSERTLNDTLSIPVAVYQSLQEQEPLPEMVDLGLSVMWATCNLGASRPEELGDSYAWGETAPKTEITISGSVWEDYKWSFGDTGQLTRYCPDSNFGHEGFSDREIGLMPEDDVAHVVRGGNWRMPTEKEVTDLIKKCIWKRTWSSGTEGFTVISKINGNSIFLPISDPQTVYWTSSLYRKRPYSAISLRIIQGLPTVAPYARYNIFFVRPVFSK